MDNHNELIERLRTESLYKDKATLEIMDLCMEAADALEALGMENCGLKANKAIMEKVLEGKHNPHDMELINQKMLQNAQLRAELEQVKQERDAAAEDLRLCGFGCGDLCGYCGKQGTCDVPDDEFDDKWPDCWEWRGPQP